MKQLFIFIFILSSLIGYSQEGNWIETKSFEGKFRVLTPEDLIHKIDSIETDIGKLAYNTFFYQSPDKTAENLFYMVSYVDYPEFTVHSDSTELLESFFQTTVDSAVESVEGNLIYYSNSSLKDYPGRIWRIEYLENKVVIKTKAYMVDNRYYAIQAISLKELSLNSAADKFFNSFKVFGVNSDLE